MRAVPEFGRALLSAIGAPPGKIKTYTEVRLPDLAEKNWGPGGAIVVERARARWRCLVEVKTAGNALKAEQLVAYLDLAREHSFDSVLTISNDITSSGRVAGVAQERRR